MHGINHNKLSAIPFKSRTLSNSEKFNFNKTKLYYKKYNSKRDVQSESK